MKMLCKILFFMTISLFFGSLNAEPVLSNTADEFTRALSTTKPMKLRGVAKIVNDQAAQSTQAKPRVKTITTPAATATTTTTATANNPVSSSNKNTVSTQAIADSPPVVAATTITDHQAIAAQNYQSLTQTHPAAATLVQFETNSDKIRSDAYGVLNELAKALRDSLPDAVLLVAGHTDSQGSANYNLNLSQRRAQAVKNYLVNRGIAANRLIVKGYGEAHPMASNNTSDGRALNRRSEFIRIGSL